MGFSFKQKSILALFGLVVIGFILKAATFDKVALAIESGNAKEVAKFFGKEVELTMNEEEDVYSRTKAEIQLKNFFTQNDPKSFNVIHNGSSSEGSKYAIGNLKTNNGTFRTYVLIEKKNNQTMIKEMRFERE